LKRKGLRILRLKVKKLGERRWQGRGEGEYDEAGMEEEEKVD
jgi:hypothetical protein